MPSNNDLWSFLLPGYFITVAIELPILMFFLSKRHSWKRRLAAGFGLTAFTYPIVVLVLPVLVWQPYSRTVYLVVAEVFAPLAECTLFYWLWIRDARDDRETATTSQSNPRHNGRSDVRDYAVIVLANICSFAPIECLRLLQWIDF